MNSYEDILRESFSEVEFALSSVEEKSIECAIKNNLFGEKYIVPSFMVEAAMELKHAEMKYAAEQYIFSKYDEYTCEAFGLAQSDEMKQAITEGFKDKLNNVKEHLKAFIEKLKLALQKAVFKIKNFFNKIYAAISDKYSRNVIKQYDDLQSQTEARLFGDPSINKELEISNGVEKPFDKYAAMIRNGTNTIDSNIKELISYCGANHSIEEKKEAIKNMKIEIQSEGIFEKKKVMTIEEILNRFGMRFILDTAKSRKEVFDSIDGEYKKFIEYTKVNIDLNIKAAFLSKASQAVFTALNFFQKKAVNWIRERLSITKQIMSIIPKHKD